MENIEMKDILKSFIMFAYNFLFPLRLIFIDKYKTASMKTIRDDRSKVINLLVLLIIIFSFPFYVFSMIY